MSVICRVRAGEGWDMAARCRSVGDRLAPGVAKRCSPAGFRTITGEPNEIDELQYAHSVTPTFRKRRMNHDVDHVLLTRFNLPSLGAESVIRAKEGWLRNRVELFEQYCLPSVRAQNNQNFHWIVYFDPQSPLWLRARIADHGAIYTPIFRESVSRAELIGDMRSVMGPQRSELITTNLDNDDGIAPDFVDRLQSVSTAHPRTAIYLANGLIKSSNLLYFRTDRTNAFCSVREGWDDPRTCWTDWHNLLANSMPIVVVDCAPTWLQVIHGTNVSNRVRGRLVSPTEYRSRFPGLLDDVAVPSPRERAHDLLLARPRRFVRESGRAAAKGVVMRLVGKEGLDRAKALLATRGRIRRG
jgi:Putative rhamnosyl transferase